LSYVGVIFILLYFLLVYSEKEPIARKSEANDIKGRFFEETALMLN